jgi:uncharacterized protein YegP (UPF0339 family)
MEPRYQCLGLEGRWTWRLLGSNHRELARAWGSFDTQEQAAADALVVGHAAATGTMEISVSADTSWRWILFVDGQPRAASSVHYARRLECQRAVARFRDCAPLAAIGTHPLVHRTPPHSRPGNAPGRGTGQFPGDHAVDARGDPRPDPAHPPVGI